MLTDREKNIIGMKKDTKAHVNIAVQPSPKHMHAFQKLSGGDTPELPRNFPLFSCEPVRINYTERVALTSFSRPSFNPNSIQALFFS